MRDPYEVLGVARGASLEQVKEAYRRACKSRHPDMGGSHEAMVELNTAYAFVLNELKHGFQQQQKEEPKRKQGAGAGEEAWRDVHGDESYDARRDTYWRNIYRDIDDELETIRRAAEQYDEQLRAMREAAWRTGQRAAWAKLTFDDLFGFLMRTARSGVKGLALLFAALVGIGSVLVEANVVSALILLGSALGFLFSLALKSDKGGMMSAALLLFGVMTLWMPPVRGALLLYPLATISVLILLALIFKFAQAGGAVGVMTGGVLALYVIVVIVNDTARRAPQVVVGPMTGAPAAPTYPPVDRSESQPYRPGSPAPVSSAPAPGPQTAMPAVATAPPLPTVEPSPPPEPRTLLAADGAILKFVAGVPYHLKVRTGFTTSLRATQGKVSLASGDDQVGECVDTLELPMQTGATPYREIDAMLRACGSDAIMTVSAVR